VSDLRFRSRHVHATLFDYIKTNMMTLGWGDASLGPDDEANAAVPFNSTPITWVQDVPDENSVDVAPNTVAITLGDEDMDRLGQLGGGYYWLQIPLFLDAFGVDQGTAVSIGSDLKSLVNFQMTIPLFDYTVSPAVESGDVITFETTMGPERPPASQAAADFRRNWRAVKCMLQVQYEGGF
jgi:hypothetical protein